MIYRLSVIGPIPSIKNTRRVANGRAYQPAKVKGEIDALYMQFRLQWRMRDPLKGNMRVDFQLYGYGQRGDLDNKVTALLDIMKRAGVIQDDSMKYVRKISAEAMDTDEIQRADITIFETGRKG